MKGTVLIMLILNTCISSIANCQNITDSVVMGYLRTLKDIPTPVLEISQKGKKTIRNTNFFIEPTDNFQHGKFRLNTFLFGATASHSRKYFLLEVQSPEKIVHKIIDSPTIEKAITVLFCYIQQFELSEAEKSLLIRELTYAYN